MRNAPSVTTPVGRSRLGLRLMLGAWLAALALLLAWTVHVPAHPGRQALVGVLLSLWTVLAWRAHRQTWQGELSWDGAAWSLVRAGISREVTTAVVLDLQRVLLLRVEAAGPPRAQVRWCWLEATGEPAAWLALRRALYSRARKDALPSPGDEAAQP